MNSKQKGSRGERMLRDVWKKHGYEDAHRSQQYSGKGESSADIEGIDPRLHIECKTGYSFKQIYNFMEQAKRDAKEGQTPICNIKMDRMPWLWVCYLEDGIEMWKNQEEMIPIIPMELKKEFHIDDVDENRRSIFEDILRVVRCRDCKWYKPNQLVPVHPLLGGGIVYENHCDVNLGFAPKENDFCSRGERKDNE